MSIFDFFGLTGSILSIISAIVSIFIAKKVKKMKNEIYAKIKISNYTELIILHGNSIKQLKLITLKDKIERGVNIKEIINTLQILLENLNEYKSDLKGDGFENIETFTTTLKNRIIELNKIEIKDFKDLKEKCYEIYYDLIENKKYFVDSKNKL